MKKLFVLSIIALAFTFIISGCKTGPDGQKSLNLPAFSVLTNYSTVAKIVAKDATILTLAKKPELRPGFVQARDDLRMLAASPQINMSSVVAIVQRLDPKQLDGQTAKMVYGDVQIILEDTINRKVAILDKAQSADAAVLADALAQGITIGLGD